MLAWLSPPPHQWPAKRGLIEVTKHLSLEYIARAPHLVLPSRARYTQFGGVCFAEGCQTGAGSHDMPLALTNVRFRAPMRW